MLGLLKVNFYSIKIYPKYIFVAILLLINFNLTAQLSSGELLKRIIGNKEVSDNRLRIDGRLIQNEAAITRIYESNEYKLLWSKNRNINAMMVVLRYAWREGLQPEDYHLSSLERYFHLRKKTEQQQIYFDILLTDAFLSYAGHLLRGKTNPKLLYETGWDISSRNANLLLLLSEALTNKSIPSSLENLAPDYTDYRLLKQELARYQSIKQEADWNKLSDDKRILPGDFDGRIPTIRNRLQQSRQMGKYPAMESTFYDSTLLNAVKKFQEQHGLEADGIIGKLSTAALNLTADDYIKLIRLNMERFRWLPESLGEAHGVINIPDFSMYVKANDTLVLEMKTIVGRPERKTPVLSSTIKYITLNPTWTVPPTILREDVLPAVRRNINYLSINRLRVINRAGQEIDPVNLPWATYTELNFPYIIRQDPGLYNSLGLIKFSFPNNYTVFLHDTNYRALFKETNRALSSGCIRIEHPFALAEYLVKDADRLNKGISSGETQTILLRQNLPIHLLYFTAFIHQGELHIRPDIYSYDEILWKALKAPVH
jgi:L,D-transpeptidase YcbB